MKRKLMLRVAVVAVAQLILFEVLMCASVHWRESTEELLTFGLFLALLGACVWAACAVSAASRVARWCWRGLLTACLFLGVYGVTYFYSWNVRPQWSWYRTPDWVADHPGFQRQLQERIGAAAKP